MNNLNIKDLFSGMFSDVLDSLGYRDCVIPGVKPINANIKILGRVRTLELINVNSVEIPENIEKGLSFLESVEKNQILFVKGSDEYAYFGELMTRLSQRQGVQAAVVCGLSRDSSYIVNSGFNFFSSGFLPSDIKGRGQVKAVDGTVIINKVTVNSGDCIFGDSDGIVIIPKKIEQTVLDKIQEMVVDEKLIVDKINSGFSVGEILKSHNSF